MYKFGFFYHLPLNSHQYQELILGFDGEIFRFYFIEYKMIPFKYQNLSSHYYELSIPVIFKNNGSTITEIVFLNDLALNLYNDKRTLDLPGFKIVIGESIETHDLLNENVSILEKLKIHKRESRLARIIIERLICNRNIEVLRSQEKISFKDKYWPNRWQGVIKQYVNYINSINIENILSSLYVKVWDYHRTKIGDDDTYYVYREARLLDGTIVTDPYLRHIIGLGDECIEKESGYTSYFSRPNIPFGIYEGEDLEKEKRKIIASYSKEEHMGWLFYNQLFKQEDIKSEISKLSDRINKTIDELEEKFFYKELSKLDPRLFNEFSSYTSNHEDILNRLNVLLGHIQRGTKIIKVLITGNIPFGIERLIRKKIGDIIESMSRNNRFILITGNAKGAENLAMRYALEHQLEIVCDYNNWTLMGRENGKERAHQMINITDILIVTEYQSITSRNLLNEAKDKGIPVKIIK